MQICPNCHAEFAPKRAGHRYCSQHCGSLASQRRLYRQRHAAAYATASGRAQKAAQIDLGLSISAATLAPGKSRTCAEIARYCGCSKQAIDQIYNSALQKLRNALRRQGIVFIR